MTLLKYQSEIPQQRVRAFQEIETTRQALMRGEATEKTLAYARFLDAVENDATLSHGTFKKFQHDDASVFRRFPFLESTST